MNHCVVATENEPVTHLGLPHNLFGDGVHRYFDYLDGLETCLRNCLAGRPSTSTSLEERLTNLSFFFLSYTCCYEQYFKTISHASDISIIIAQLRMSIATANSFCCVRSSVMLQLLACCKQGGVLCAHKSSTLHFHVACLGHACGSTFAVPPDPVKGPQSKYSKNRCSRAFYCYSIQ